jgi:hypothetical protein
MEQELLGSIDFVLFARFAGTIPHVRFAPVRFFSALYAEAFIVIPFARGFSSEVRFLHFPSLIMM